MIIKNIITKQQTTKKKHKKSSIGVQSKRVFFFIQSLATVELCVWRIAAKNFWYNKIALNIRGLGTHRGSREQVAHALSGRCLTRRGLYFHRLKTQVRWIEFLSAVLWSDLKNLFSITRVDEINTRISHIISCNFHNLEFLRNYANQEYTR